MIFWPPSQDLQEQQDKEEEEKQAARHAEEDDESQDMFAPNHPLLDAAYKRDSLTKSAQPVNICTQGRQDNRNTFAKRVGGGGSVGSPSQGPGCRACQFGGCQGEKVLVRALSG